MNNPEVAPRKPLAGLEGTAEHPGHLWGIVLAGGEGVRLRPLNRRVYGEERPGSVRVRG